MCIRDRLFLYPLAVALIILALTDSISGGSRKVYALSAGLTILPSLYDALKFLKIAPASLAPIMDALPLSQYSMGWISFFLAGYIAGLILEKLSPSAAAEKSAE